jgi:hypothetical protein
MVTAEAIRAHEACQRAGTRRARYGARRRPTSRSVAGADVQTTS